MSEIYESNNPVNQQIQQQQSREQGVIPKQAGEVQTTNAKGAQKGAQTVETQGPFAADTIDQDSSLDGASSGFMTINGELVFQTVPSNPGAPELSLPSTAVNQEAVEHLNVFFNSTGLTTLTIALELMALAMQKQKLIDKQGELKLADLTYKMTEASAELTIQLGHLEQMEHIWKGVTMIAAGVATAGAAKMLPNATQTAGASYIASFEILKAISNAASEFVSAAYAVPKATIQALKQIKDQVIQLLMANKEALGALAREDQEALDRQIQALSDMIQKLKRAYEVPG